MLRLWSNFVHVVSFEWLLKKYPNGGDIIFLRAVLIALFLHILIISVKHGIDPTRSILFSVRELRLEVGSTFPWLGAIFAATYAALYARFSSQWSYLANLYNQIKTAEIRTLISIAEKNLPDDSARTVMKKLAEWKAGYIEDAQNLHLATKESIAPVIWFWLREEDVRNAYLHATPGGVEKCQSLLDSVGKVTNRLGGIKEYG